MLILTLDHSFVNYQYLFRGINPDTPRNLAKAVTVD